MYAIVKTGGKQYRVERGQTLLVERLPADEGASVALEPLMFRADRAEDTVLDKDGLEGVKVTAKVLAHERGEKLRVFKFKPKRGYKKRNGHRQELTRIEVTEISAGKAKAKAATAAEQEKAPAKETAPAKEKAPAKAKAAAKAKAPAAKEEAADGS